MATSAFIDAVLTVNAVGLSDHVKSVTLNISADELDDTAMGDIYRSRIGGLKGWSLSVEFNSDFAVGEVDATLFPLLGTVVPITLKPTSAATSTSNPQYSGSVLVSQVNPLGNSVGDLATTSVTWSGSGVLTRATA